VVGFCYLFLEKKIPVLCFRGFYAILVLLVGPGFVEDPRPVGGGCRAIPIVRLEFALARQSFIIQFAVNSQ